MKDSFILYTKYIKQIKSLSMEQRGMLFTSILLHESCGGDLIPELDVATQIAFDFICADLEENAQKYLDKCATNAQNGAKGGRPRKQPQEKKTEKTERFSEKRTQAKKPDNDNDYDNDSKEKDILTDIPKESPAKAEPLMVASREIVDYLNQKIGTHYVPSAQETVKLIKDRMKAGHSVDDFKKVIDTKAAEWLGTEQAKYLRPETLFSAKHFESYLNQKPGKPRGQPEENRFDRGMAKRTGQEKAEHDALVAKLVAMG